MTLHSSIKNHLLILVLLRKRENVLPKMFQVKPIPTKVLIHKVVQTDLQDKVTTKAIARRVKVETVQEEITIVQEEITVQEETTEVAKDKLVQCQLN
ncbi:hypothetical protein D3C72_1828570 [compost metagenome]